MATISEMGPSQGGSVSKDYLLRKYAKLQAKQSAAAARGHWNTAAKLGAEINDLGKYLTT